MKSKILYLMALIFVISIAGCKSVELFQPAPEEPVKIDLQNFSSITEMKWTLKSMKIAGEEYDLDGDVPYISFDSNGKVNGFASINSFFGSAKIDNSGNLQWSPFGATRMAGPGYLMKQENVFLKALESTQQFFTVGLDLHACKNNMQTELIFYISE